MLSFPSVDYACMKAILLTALLIFFQQYSFQIYQKLSYDPCHPIVVHTPYQCASKLFRSDQPLGKWLLAHGHQYDTLGMISIMRHASRYSLAKPNKLQDLKLRFKPGTEIRNYIEQVLDSAYPYGELRPEGRVEARRLGKRFRTKHFPTFFSNLEASDVKMMCSNTSRTLHTMLFFTGELLSHLDGQQCQIEDDLRFEIKKPEVKDANDQIAKQIAFVNDELGELLESNLTHDDFSTFLALFSVHDVIDRTERLTGFFGRSNLKSINILREQQRFMRSSLANVEANKTLQRLLNIMISDVEAIYDGNLKLVQYYTHDSMLIGMMDYIGFFEGSADVANRRVPMASNWHAVLLRHKVTQELHILPVFNEHIQQVKNLDALSQDEFDSTFSASQFLQHLKTVAAENATMK